MLHLSQPYPATLRWSGSSAKLSSSAARWGRLSFEISTFVWGKHLHGFNNKSEVITWAVSVWLLFAPFAWLLLWLTPVDWIGSHKLFIWRPVHTLGLQTDHHYNSSMPWRKCVKVGEVSKLSSTLFVFFQKNGGNPTFESWHLLLLGQTCRMLAILPKITN